MSIYLSIKTSDIIKHHGMEVTMLAPNQVQNPSHQSQAIVPSRTVFQYVISLITDYLH